MPRGPRARYAAVSLVGQGLFALLAFVASILIARLLGPSGRGSYTAWTLVTYFGALLLTATVPVGLGRGYLRGDRDTLLPSAWRHGALTVIVVTIVSGVALAAGVDPTHLVLFVLLAIPVGVIQFDLLLVFQASKDAWRYQLPRIVGAALVTGTALWLYLDRPVDAEVIVWIAFAVGSLVAALMLSVLVARRVGYSLRTRLREYAELGRGSFVATMCDQMILRVGQVAVVALIGTAALGVYGVAVNWSEVGQYMGTAIAHSVFESEATLDRRDALRAFRRSAIVVGAASVAIALGGFFLIAPLFGDLFADARWPLLILAPGVPARAVAAVGNQILLAQGRGRVAARITWQTLLAGIPIVVLGTVTLGIEGAAAASTLVYFLQAFLSVLPFRDDSAQDSKSTSASSLSATRAGA